MSDLEITLREAMRGHRQARGMAVAGRKRRGGAGGHSEKRAGG